MRKVELNFGLVSYKGNGAANHRPIKTENKRMKYYVESNNGYGPFGVIKEFDNYKEAKKFADEYSKYNQVKTRVTTI